MVDELVYRFWLLTCRWCTYFDFLPAGDALILTSYLQVFWLLGVVVVPFSSLAMIWGECSTIHSSAVLLFFSKVEISFHTLIQLFRPGSDHSGSASQDNCGRVFPDKLCVSLILDRFSHYTWTAAYSPLQLRWVTGVCMFRCNLPTFGRMTWVFCMPLRWHRGKTDTE